MNESDDYRARGRARMKRLDELAATAQPAQAAPALPPTKGQAPNAAPPSTKTLEEALAVAEAQIAERVRYARDNAAQIAQREEDQARLKARFDALPQAERRRVLDQAGLRHVSAAPAPINPLRGGRGAAWKPPSNPIDWSHWRQMPVLPLWHAVVLSLNQNPEGFHPDTADDLVRKRMDVCLAHLSTGLLKLRNSNDATLPVDVSAFRVWADSLGLDLPEKFPAAVSANGTDPKAGQVSRAVPRVGDSARAGGTLPPSQLDEKTGRPKYSMTRAGLVKAQKHRWPTIEADLKSANENGLAKAKADVRGWHEGEALEWARTRGKLSEGPGVTLSAAMRNLPTTKHKLQD